MCVIVFDVYYRPVFSESLLGFGVSSGEFKATVAIEIAAILDTSEDSDGII